MALQLGALRDALLEAGASEESANRASEEMAALVVKRPYRDLWWLVPVIAFGWILFGVIVGLPELLAVFGGG
jgi:hypothetical protein